MAERIRREEYAKMEHKLKATGGEAVTKRRVGAGERRTVPT